MAELIISVSGLRGIIGETLTPDVVLHYVAAFHETAPPGKVILSFDGRTTGPMLTDLVRACLSAAGREVLDVGVAATPTVGVLVRQHEAAGAIQISASHNPPEYNGIKLFNKSGRVIPADEGENVRKRYLELRSGGAAVSSGCWAGFDSIGSSTALRDTQSAHAELILKRVDVDRIRKRRFRVLLDSNHGAGGALGRHVLEELGCQLTTCGEQATGKFAHPPEPTADNLESIRGRVTSFKADVGFCQDPDADRLALIDANGRYIGEEFTLALCLDHVLQVDRGPVVVNCATSRMAEDLAERYGVPFFRSAVGEANVVNKMHEVSACFGGEGNGGPIDPQVGFVRDSFVGMALVLDGLAARTDKSTLAAWADSLPQYTIRKSKVTLAPEYLAAVYTALQSKFAEATAEDSDGLRMDWPGRWLLVRPSNTEPIVRLIAEASEAQDADQMIRSAVDVIQRVQP